ncbi:MAG: HAD-IA family hydrolase [Polyangiaceae bacterium]|nr:HAD-IA family hydrolase [Polyangiaceae bacterium]
MPRYATVLFDLDGTLLDSIGLIVESFHHTTERHGLPRQTDAHWLAGIGTPLAAAFAPFAAGPAERDALIATYRSYNLARHDARVRAYPGVVAAVRAVAARGAALAVVTSKNRATARRGLELVGLGDTFEIVVGGDDVTRPKPHREPVDRALELLGRAADGSVLVGDSVHDVACAHAAGVASAAVTWGPFSPAQLLPSRPHHLLHAPEELVALVAG